MFATSYVLLWLAFGLYIALIFQTGPRLGWAASAVTALSWLSLTAALVARGLETGHWPLTNRYEFAWCFVWSILLVYLLLELRRRYGPRDGTKAGARRFGAAPPSGTRDETLLRGAPRKASPDSGDLAGGAALPPASRDETVLGGAPGETRSSGRDLAGGAAPRPAARDETRLRGAPREMRSSSQDLAGGAVVLGIALLLATYALLRPADEKAIRPLLPALRSVWLQIHVLTAAVGYGACAVGAALALMQLLLPTEELTEPNVERVIGWGFPWLTAGILSGAIWAQEAWGRYWGWDPKETWTLIIWLWYLLLLHIRGLRNWRGKRMAWLALAGFGIILFAFAGLPWLLRTVRLESLHGF